MKEKYSRFSKQAIIDRYFKKPHGYAVIFGVFLVVQSFLEGPRDFSHSWGGPTYMTSKLLAPIFGEYATVWLFVTLTILVILDAELRFTRRK